MSQSKVMMCKHFTVIFYVKIIIVIIMSSKYENHAGLVCVYFRLVLLTSIVLLARQHFKSLWKSIPTYPQSTKRKTFSLKFPGNNVKQKTLNKMLS